MHLSQPIYRETAWGTAKTSLVGDVQVAQRLLVGSTHAAPCVLLDVLIKRGCGYSHGGGKAVLRSKGVRILLPERDHHLYWLADTCKRVCAGPLQAWALEATEIVTVRIADGALLVRVPQPSSASIPKNNSFLCVTGYCWITSSWA